MLHCTNIDGSFRPIEIPYNTQQQHFCEQSFLNCFVSNLFLPRTSTLTMTSAHLQCRALTIHNLAIPMMMVYHKNNSHRENGSWSGTEKVTLARWNSIFNKYNVPTAHRSQKQTQILLPGVLHEVTQCRELRVWRKSKWRASHLKSRTCPVHLARNL